MRKKSLIIVLVFCLMFGFAIILNGCGGKNWVDITVEYPSSEIQVIDLKAHNSIDGFNPSPDKGENVIIDVWLCEVYDVDTLKIYSNETELTLQKDENFSESNLVSTDLSKVGYITLENIQSDVTLKFEVEERDITYSFVLAQDVDETLLSEKQNMLEDFVLSDQTNLYEAITNQNYVYSTKYSKIKDINAIELNCNKKIGYYNIDNLIVDDNCYLFKNAEKNKYSYNINTPNFENEVKINPEVIKVNSFCVINDCGGILDISTKNSTDYSDLSANSNEVVTLTLKDAYNVDLTNVELYINDYKVELTNNSYVFQINSMFPVDFSPYAETSYTVTVKNIGTENVNGLKSVKINNAQINTDYSSSAVNHYCLNDNTIYYEKDFCAAIIFYKTNSLKISSSDNEFTINFEDYLKNDVEGFDSIYFDDTTNQVSGEIKVENNKIQEVHLFLTLTDDAYTITVV